jgi:hypothetical protein
VKCFYCAAPATHGYRDMPRTLHCDDCVLVYWIHTSCADALNQVRQETSPERLRRALAHEIADHGGRTTLVKALEVRLRKLARQAASVSSVPSVTP